MPIMLQKGLQLLHMREEDLEIIIRLSSTPLVFRFLICEALLMVHGQAFSPVVETKNATRVRQSQVIGKSADATARMGMSAAQRKTVRLL